MKILLVLHSYFPRYFAGTEVYTHNLAKALAKAGHSVKIFTIEPQTRETISKVERYYEEAVEVIKIHHPKPKPAPRLIQSVINDEYVIEFKAILDEYQPELVHIQHLLGLSLDFIDIVKTRNIKVVFTAHDLWYKCPSLRGYFQGEKCLCTKDSASGMCAGLVIGGFYDYTKIENPLVKFLLRLDWKLQRDKRNRTFRQHLRKADLVIVPSQYLYNDILEYGLDPDKVRFIQHGIQAPSPQLVGNKVTDKKLRFLFASHLTIDKGFALTVKNFLKLEKSGLDFTLDIYGSYSSGDLEIVSYLDRIKDSKKIKYRGTFKPTDKYEIFSKYNVVLVPSLWNEIYGLVLDEALALKKFALVSNKGALSERVVEGKNGLIFDTSKPGDFLDKLYYIFEHQGELLNRADYPKTWIDLKEHIEVIQSAYKAIL
ncbi:MAG: glycosyltransferase [Bacteroidota bacterium]|nr:glycosyltransferase [Bacteroidota bacterium]